jgi:hypothetical protein
MLKTHEAFDIRLHGSEGRLQPEKHVSTGCGIDSAHFDQHIRDVYVEELPARFPTVNIISQGRTNHQVRVRDSIECIQAATPPDAVQYVTKFSLRKKGFKGDP